MRRKRASGLVTRSMGSLGSLLSRGSSSCCRPILAIPEEELWDMVTPSDRRGALTPGISRIPVGGRTVIRSILRQQLRISGSTEASGARAAALPSLRPDRLQLPQLRRIRFQQVLDRVCPRGLAAARSRVLASIAADLGGPNEPGREGCRQALDDVGQLEVFLLTRGINFVVQQFDLEFRLHFDAVIVPRVPPVYL